MPRRKNSRHQPKYLKKKDVGHYLINLAKNLLCAIYGTLFLVGSYIHVLTQRHPCSQCPTQKSVPQLSPASSIHYNVTAYAVILFNHGSGCTNYSLELGAQRLLEANCEEYEYKHRNECSCLYISNQVFDLKLLALILGA